MPLKLSSVFDALFEQEISIKSLIKQSGLNKYHFREVQQQFDTLYDLIDSHKNNILNNNNYAK